MKKIIYRKIIYFFPIILAGMILPASAVFAEGDSHKPITQELINLVEKNPEIQNMLQASIAEAKKSNPDLKTNPAQSIPKSHGAKRFIRKFITTRTLVYKKIGMSLHLSGRPLTSFLADT